MNAAQRNGTSAENLESDNSTQSATDDLETDRINAELEAKLEAENDPDMNEVTRELLSHTDGISNVVDNQNDGVNDDEVGPQEYGDGRGGYRRELEGLTDSETFDGLNDQPAERFSDDGA